MRHQEATTVLPLPLTAVENRLRDVEAWSEFLLGIESIRYTSHERYAFQLADGRDRRELKVVVKLRYKEHCFVWHGLAGPSFRGSLKLAGVDAGHTSITLMLESVPVDMRSSFAEWLMPKINTATVDLHLLERYLLPPAQLTGT